MEFACDYIFVPWDKPGVAGDNDATYDSVPSGHAEPAPPTGPGPRLYPDPSHALPGSSPAPSNANPLVGGPAQPGAGAAHPGAGPAPVYDYAYESAAPPGQEYQRFCPEGGQASYEYVEDRKGSSMCIGRGPPVPPKPSSMKSPPQSGTWPADYLELSDQPLARQPSPTPGHPTFQRRPPPPLPTSARPPLPREASAGPVPPPRGESCKLAGHRTGSALGGAARSPESGAQARQANLNVVSVAVGELIANGCVEAVRGAPVSCLHCSAALSSISTISNTPSGDTVWNCEFCGRGNVLDLRYNPVPPLPDVTFAGWPARSPPSDARHRPLVVFCVDVSGSMCVTSEVEGSGNESGGAAQKVLHMSRLQWVQESLQVTLERMALREPHTCVGLVTFNDQVVIHGDGSGDPVTLSEFELLEETELRRRGENAAHMGVIGSTLPRLTQRIAQLTEGGSTALGPACVVAMAMAARAPGSKVLVCTDGRANSCLGDLENVSNDDIYSSSRGFYQALGGWGASHGVQVSIVTLEGTDCRVAELGSLADSTGGRVVTCHPAQLGSTFFTLIDEQLVGSMVQVALVVSSQIRFRYEEVEEALDEVVVVEKLGETRGSSRATRNLGSATRDTEVTFEFEARPGHEAALSQLHQLPFQLQLSFLPVINNNNNNDDDTTAAATVARVTRVVTRSVAVTTERAVAEATARAPVLAAHGARLGARLAQIGHVGEAAAVTNANQTQLLKLASGGGQEEEDIYQDWMETMSPVYGEITRGADMDSNDGSEYGTVRSPKPDRVTRFLKSCSDEVAGAMFRVKRARGRLFLRSHRGSGEPAPHR